MIDPHEGRTTEVDHHCGHSAIQGLLGPSTIITRYELRVGSGIYVRSAGFWIIWKETDPGITAILWYRDSSSSDLRSLFFFLSLFSLILANRPPLLSFLHPPCLVGRVRKSRNKSLINTIQRKTRNAVRPLYSDSKIVERIAPILHIQ